MKQERGGILIITCLHLFHCSMYILLRGQITIYILYASKADGDDDNSNQPVLTAKASEGLRQQLGTFVCHLGEVAHHYTPEFSLSRLLLPYV